MKLSIWVQVCGFYCVSLIHMLPHYWCPVIQTMRTPDMTHHHSIYYYCNISNTAALNELVGLFQGARLEYSCFMKVETFFFPSSPLLSFPLLSSPLLSSPLLMLFLSSGLPTGLAAGSRPPSERHRSTLSFLLKNRVINAARTASSSCVGVPLMLQTCLAEFPNNLLPMPF